VSLRDTVLIKSPRRGAFFCPRASWSHLRGRSLNDFQKGPSLGRPCSGQRLQKVGKDEESDQERNFFIGGLSAFVSDATCTAATSPFSGSSTSSPITVSGLTNAVACIQTVTATDSVGTSSASAATVPITPGEQVGSGLTIWLPYQINQWNGTDVPIRAQLDQPQWALSCSLSPDPAVTVVLCR